MVQIFYGAITTESVLIFVLLLFTLFIFGNLFYMLIRALTRNRLTPNLSRVVSRILTYLFYAVGLYIGISRILGVNISTIATALGVAGILIAISSQQILQNIFAGLIIALERPFKIGDWVEVGGSPQAGLSRVRDITLLRTVLRSINGHIVIVSNSTLIGSNIFNYTKGDFLRMPVKLTVPISSDLEKVKAIILETCTKHEKILPNVPKKEKSSIMKFVKLQSIRKILQKPAVHSTFQPRVNLKEISESGIVLEIWVWIWEIHNKDIIVSDLLQKLLVEFKKNKIHLA